MTEKSTLKKVFIAVMSAACILFVFLLISLGGTENVEVQKEREDLKFERIQEYSYKEIRDENAPAGIIDEYTFILSEDFAHDQNLAFYTVHQYVDVYLDEEHVYSLKLSKENQYTKTVGSNWIALPLYHEDAGKTVRIQLAPVYENYRMKEVDFLVGSKFAIYRNQFTEDMPQLITSVVIIFTGCSILAIALYGLLKKRRGKSVFALGLVAIMVGLWRFTDTVFIAVLFPSRPVLLYSISVVMLMMGIIPLVKSIRKEFGRVVGCILDSYCIVTIVVCILQMILQLLGVRDLRENLYIIHGFVIFGGIVITGNKIFEWIRKREGIIHFLVNNFFWICVVGGVLADICTYYIKGSSSNLMFTVLAFLIYVIFRSIQAVFEYYEQQHLLNEKEELLAETERQLSQSRVTTMMGQIRAHFIFNILNAISGMCKYDPEKADETIVRFSRFLRTNINIMQNDMPVTFQEELRHLDDYIVLEQIRFADKIRFIKELEIENFMIPSLSIQPIVENSIKHGIMPKKTQGTIWLRTWKERDIIFVSIRDDGIGFDTEQKGNEESVGMNNVRFRLKHMVDGEMKVESIPGKGTIVTFLIPCTKVTDT